MKQVNEHYLPDVHVPYLPTDKGSPNAPLNIDGFGLAWYTDVAARHDEEIPDGLLMPCFYKSIQPPLNNVNLASLACNVESTCVFAHIRAATGPVAIQNCHPFTFGRWTFQHNGVIGSRCIRQQSLMQSADPHVEGFSDIKVKLMGLLSPKALKHVLGTTDSELAAALFIDNLHTDGDWNATLPLTAIEEALRATIRQIGQLIESVGGEGDGHSALNFAATDGEQLVCTRFASPVGHEPPSLYYSTTEGATLDRQYQDEADGPAHDSTKPDRKRKEQHAKHVVVCSEPCTYRREAWHLLPKNTMLSYGKSKQVALVRI